MKTNAAINASVGRAADRASARQERSMIWKGYSPGSDLFYLAFPEAKHDENAWAARSPIPLQFLFGKLPVFDPSRAG